MKIDNFGNFRKNETVIYMVSLYGYTPEKLVFMGFDGKSSEYGLFTNRQQRSLGMQPDRLLPSDLKGAYFDEAEALRHCQANILSLLKLNLQDQRRVARGKTGKPVDSAPGEPIDIAMMVLENPGCRAVIDNDWFSINFPKPDDFDSLDGEVQDKYYGDCELMKCDDETSVLSKYTGYQPGHRYGGHLLQAMADILLVKI